MRLDFEQFLERWPIAQEPTPRYRTGADVRTAPAKGAGEGGIIAVGGVMANAVANALSSLGVEPRQLPLTPNYIWELINRGSVPRVG